MKVIGLMSGTSVDGIDAALVEISGTEANLKVKLINGKTFAYSPELRARILTVCSGQKISISELAVLDDDIATQFAIAAQQIQVNQPRAELIGSHGQTVYHRPPVKVKDQSNDNNLGYSVQLGRGDLIAQINQIQTVSNFRAGDIALWGEGAPLVPKIDACLLSHPTKSRAIQNIGGIGNVAYLPPNQIENWSQQICGWDTGPGNSLLDLAIAHLTNGDQTYDHDGQWAAKGTPHHQLVSHWLKQDFFLQSPPKSTGRELFGQEYLDQCWQEMTQLQLNHSDRLATLTELTVASIVQSYRQYLPQIPDQILLCGGGSNNSYLRHRLQAELTSAQVTTTDEVGLDSNFKEAIAFAVLAYWRINSIPGNLPQVTGAKKPTLLGSIHSP